MLPEEKRKKYLTDEVLFEIHGRSDVVEVHSEAPDAKLNKVPEHDKEHDCNEVPESNEVPAKNLTAELTKSQRQTNVAGPIGRSTTSFYGNWRGRFVSKRFSNLADVHEYNFEKKINKIVVLPPAIGDNGNIPSDEEEDLEGEEITLDVPLEVAGEVEVQYEGSDSNESESEDVELEENEEDEEDGGVVAPKVKKRKSRAKASVKRKKPTPKAGASNVDLDEEVKWGTTPLKNKLHLQDFHPYEKVSSIEGWSPFEVWNLIFSTDIISYITEQTEIYAKRDKGDHSFYVGEGEMSKFLGFVLLTGYHSLPSEVGYWSTEQDLQVPIVVKAMSRNRYQTIKKYFHVADNNNLEKGNKAAKVQPFYNKLNDNLKQFGILHQKLSIDESMVPYRGLHSCKMYMKSKPIKFGFKLWVLCGADGYPYHLSIYQGKTDTKFTYGLGGDVILQMINIVARLQDGNLAESEFFFDNYFTGYDLMKHLADRKIMATGTVRSNRTKGATEKMTSDKIMKKKERGSYDYTCDGNVFCTIWNDNSVVRTMSTVHTHEPVQNASRFKKGVTGRIALTQPFVIKKYNEGMGGVDVMDRLIGSYRPRISAKKWWFTLFVNALNVSVTAAWRLWQIANPKETMSHKDFRRQITLVLLVSGDDANLPRRELPTANLPRDVQVDGKGHVMAATSQGRCKMCKRNCRKKCVKCNVRLHTDRGTTCYYEYHDL